jgi:hypothetical protein
MHHASTQPAPPSLSAHHLATPYHRSSAKIMSNQVYYVLARVRAGSIGLYAEAPDFDSAYDTARNRIAESYHGPFVIQALQLIHGQRAHATR